MIRTRHILSPLLALVIALTGVTMAVARGQLRAVGSVVICSGYGIVTVALDAEGNPTGPMHPCPDCVLGCLAPAPDPVTMPVPVLGRAVPLGLAAQSTPAGLSWCAPFARGPPPAT